MKPSYMTIFTALFLFLIGPMAQAEAHEYKLDTSHSKIGFEISHLVISTVEGQFNKFVGSYSIDKENRKVSEVKFSIDSDSIDTNEVDRDKHLRSDEFFDVKKYPKITFESKKVHFKSGVPVKIQGELDMHGVKKAITLKVKWKGEATDPWGNMKQVFELEGDIKRSDFNLSWNKALDKGGMMIGDEVKLVLRIQANKVKKQ